MIEPKTNVSISPTVILRPSVKIPSESKLVIKERRLYFFDCPTCGTENRQSFKRSIAKKRKCRKCRFPKVHKNQLSFFRRITGNVSLSPSTRKF